MARVIVGDFRTGRRLLDLPHTSLRWEATRNRAETITATAPLTDPDVAALLLGSAGTPGKAYLAVIENDVVMAAGPIWTYTYDADEATITLSAAGMWSYWDHRYILPILSAGRSIVGADTTFTGWDLGTIAKKVVVQAWQWTGGQVPILVQADRAGTRERTYLGADLDNVGSVLQQLTEVENGPDIEFRPRWSADRLGVEWVLRSGTEAAPRLRSQSVHRWDYGVAERAIAGLTVQIDASNMTGHAITTGGRTSDVVLAARVLDPRLTDAGFPLLESVDSSHSSVTELTTLTAYSNEAVRNGATPTQFWSFRVRADMAPRVGEYWLGDLVEITVTGDPIIADGVYQCAISSLSGDQDGRWVAVKGGQVTMIRALGGTRQEFVIEPWPPLYPSVTVFPALDLFPGGS